MPRVTKGIHGAVTTLVSAGTIGTTIAEIQKVHVRCWKLKNIHFPRPISVSCRIAFLAWYKTGECDVCFYVLCCVEYCTHLT